MQADEIPPAPGSTTVVQEKPPAEQKSVPPRKRKNGQLNSFAKTMLSKKQQQQPQAEDSSPPANSTEDEPDAMEVDKQPVAMDSSSSSSSSSSSDSAVEDAEPEGGQQLQPARSPRRQTVRLPRNKSLYAMRDLQRSNRPIFKNLTFHRIVKTYTREILKRNDVKYSKQAMGALMRIIETMLFEQLLRAQAICLTAGRKTLMLHHLETAEHHSIQPNLGQWTVEDFEQEEGRLEPSRFPRSRLSQID